MGKQGFDIEYLVLAGGGGLETLDLELVLEAVLEVIETPLHHIWINSSTETPFFALPSTSYTVTVGSGGSGGTGVGTGGVVDHLSLQLSQLLEAVEVDQMVNLDNLVVLAVDKVVLEHPMRVFAGNTGTGSEGW